MENIKISRKAQVEEGICLSSGSALARLIARCSSRLVGARWKEMPKDVEREFVLRSGVSDLWTTPSGESHLPGKARQLPALSRRIYRDRPIEWPPCAISLRMGLAAGRRTAGHGRKAPGANARRLLKQAAIQAQSVGFVVAHSLAEAVRQIRGIGFQPVTSIEQKDGLGAHLTDVITSVAERSSPFDPIANLGQRLADSRQVISLDFQGVIFNGPACAAP